MPYPSIPGRSPTGRPVSYSWWTDLLALPVKVLAGLASLLPLPVVRWLGRAAGTLWYHVIPIRRRVVLENLRAALPDLAASERRRIGRETFEHVSKTVLELLWLTPRRHAELERIVHVDGLDRYRSIRSEGRGVIALTAHIGSWDLLACSQALTGVPLSIVTKELSARGLSRLWMHRRRDAGVSFLPARGSALAIIRALRHGEVVGMMVDQRTPAEEGGAVVPFLGLPAWTTLAPHVLAERTGAALLPVWSTRDARGRLLVKVEPEIDRRATPEETMAAINELVARWVRSAPEQWLWLHRRWKK